MDRLTNCGLLVNGKPLSWYGGAALLEYSVGETTLNVDVFQGVNRTSWRLLKSIFGRRSITITVIFTGENLHAAKLQRSKFNAAIFGRCELFISDDGFYYDCACQNTGPEILVGMGEREAKIKSDYQFSGIRRDALARITVPAGGSLFCRSTMPFTDCRLTATVGTSAASYTLGGAVFSNVTAGDALVFDGIDGAITKNGQPYAASVSWVDFPSLVPGENENDAPDAVTVEYYPTYI